MKPCTSLVALIFGNIPIFSTNSMGMDDIKSVQCEVPGLVYAPPLLILQAARELVLEVIRDKDQGDFRSGRNDFTARLGGATLDVRRRAVF